MEKWLDLLTPSAAALSLLLAIALVVQAIRHGRAVRRLETRLAEREGAAARVSLDRLTQLQRRAKTSPSPSPVALETVGSSRRDGPRLPAAGTAAAVIGVLALVAGTTWYLFLRDDGPPSAEAPSTAGQTRTGPATTAVRPSTITTIPETPKQLPQPKSAYTVLVLNGSGVPRAAANMVPIVTQAGWATAEPDNATTTDEQTSFVVFLPGNEDVADNLAKDLGITKKLPQDGVAIPADAPDVDAVVIVGLDLATQNSP